MKERLKPFNKLFSHYKQSVWLKNTTFSCLLWRIHNRLQFLQTVKSSPSNFVLQYEILGHAQFKLYQVVLLHCWDSSYEPKILWGHQIEDDLAKWDVSKPIFIQRVREPWDIIINVCEVCEKCMVRAIGEPERTHLPTAIPWGYLTRPYPLPHSVFPFPLAKIFRTIPNGIFAYTCTWTHVYMHIATTHACST